MPGVQCDVLFWLTCASAVQGDADSSNANIAAIGEEGRIRLVLERRLSTEPMDKSSLSVIL